MNYEAWYPLYNQITHALPLSWEFDEKAASLLSTLLYTTAQVIPFSDVVQILAGEDVMIFGAGPSLEKGIKKYNALRNHCKTIAADGATSALLHNDIIPNVIVTDLDGDIPDQLRANEKGSILIVHAHGDNREVIKKTIPKIKGPIIGSIQTDPHAFPNVFNVGGFTDGDRAVYLSDHCNAKTIYLVGFDFNGELGQYSLPEKKDREMKHKKLRWCSFLIKQLEQSNRIRFLTV